jgi:DNA processing protein
MTPQRLQAILVGRGAKEAFAEICSCSPSVSERLSELSSFATGRALPSDADGSPLTPERLVRQWARSARGMDVPALWCAWQEHGIDVVRLGEDRYPVRLGANPDGDPPQVLFARGDLTVADGPTVAIVGTRRATHYGQAVAAELGADLAGAGVCVVSGLALGIDASAHEGALAGCHERGPGPLGVLGGGVDVPYPFRNLRLIERVAQAGCVLSEAPPGARPEAWRFPMRNRILATLAQVLVVVESARQGGAMHTVDAAAARAREVFAVPGSVRSAASEGTNEMIASGSQVCRDATDVLVALEAACLTEGIAPPRAISERGADGGAGRVADSPGFHRLDAAVISARLGSCSAGEREIYAALEERALSIEAICARSGAGLAGVVLALDHLLELGLAEQVVGGWRSR